MKTNKSKRQEEKKKISSKDKRKTYYYVEIIDNFEDLEELLKSYKSN